jgi:hypothetical protein
LSGREPAVAEPRERLGVDAVGHAVERVVRHGRGGPRDLVDLAHALEILPTLDAQRTVDMFVEYVKQKPIPRWEAEKRMFEKLERRGFLADVRPLLTAEKQAQFDEAAGKRAFYQVFEGFISRIPGKVWASTPEFLDKFGFSGGATK